jgi:hypothetical protein
VKEKDRVLVALSEEVLSCLLKHETMSVVEGVSDLEGKDSVGIHGFSLVTDLLRSHSVLVHAVIPHNFLDEVHGLSRDKEVSLLHNSSGVRVRFLEASEGTGGDLFLSVGIEHRLVDDSDSLTVVTEGKHVFAFTSIHNFFRDVLSNRARHEVSDTIFSNSLLV